jgi:guanosine-3',5'-bis(diphosphate) 3'-pyrophosphohydrolase
MAATASQSPMPPFPANPTQEQINEHIEQTLQYLLQECRNNLRQVNEVFIEKAFRFCVSAHSLDLRASGEPYYTHPAEVAAIVAREVRLDDVSVAAALLHDVVEDTEFTLKDIREEFGDSVAQIVDGVTKISDVFKSHEVRQAASYRKLLLSMASDVRVILVKFADRLHNMRTLQFLAEHKQKRMAQETLDIYAPFAHRFGLGTIKWELEDLSFKYLNREAYDQIKSALNTKRGEREDYIEHFAAPIEPRLKEYGLTCEISGRAKHLYSIFNKMHKRTKSLDEIYDLFAVRIILDTDNINECFVVYGIVSDIYTPVPERFKNYISVPKKNGYQSLHTTVIGPSGRKVEVQIRTRSMHEIAERGVAAHFKYKERVNGTYSEDKELEEWAQWVHDIFENAGDDASAQVFESFKLNLFQEEIYVFTPKGDLRILPKGATSVDFAFDIHSKVGYHCIGAKVNGRIVPLNYELQSGDQVDILTSKNQTPSKDWERFVTTHKAKAAIRKYLNEENRKKVGDGREMWERKLKKLDARVNDDDLEKLAAMLRFTHKGDMFAALGDGSLDVDVVAKLAEERFPANPAKSKLASAPPAQQNGNGSSQESNGVAMDKFTTTARNDTSISLNGANILYSYARCCNPVPGDDVVGIVTIGSGVKIHRRSCKNLTAMSETMAARITEVQWSSQNENNNGNFLAAIRITGEDRTAMLNDITSAIASFNNTNIRGVNIDSFDSIFEGTVTVYVKNTEHLERLFLKLRKIKGVKSVERFQE